ncbi:MAG: acyl-CoA dehydratase activase-related protein [Anaerovoracaceae bacterium]
MIRSDGAGTITVGIPRAMLYYRYHTLWKAFFDALGVKTVVSGPTSRETFTRGAARANDESCLSEKIFFGHVDELIGKCDYILIPRICNYGRRREFCVRFQALPDLTRNSFVGTDFNILSYSVDEMHGIDEKNAFIDMGRQLGFTRRQSKAAYDSARKVELDSWNEEIKKEDALYHKDGVKILLAGHSYVYADPYFGGMITDVLKELDVTAIRADIVNRKRSRIDGDRISPTCKWQMNREILGSIEEHRNMVDGIILISAFPCGPDSMVNDLIMRKVQDTPILHIVLDAQSGVAGIETRLESFVDIIRLKKGTL